MTTQVNRGFKGVGSGPALKPLPSNLASSCTRPPRAVVQRAVGAACGRAACVGAASLERAFGGACCCTIAPCAFALCIRTRAPPALRPGPLALGPWPLIEFPRMPDWSDVGGVNEGYVRELYERFRQDPSSVDRRHAGGLRTVPANVRREPARPGAPTRRWRTASARPTFARWSAR